MTDAIEDNLSIRVARPGDEEGLGLVMVSAFFSAFIGAVPEKDLDLSWSPEISAASWQRYLASPPDNGEFLLVAILDKQIVGLVLAGRPSGDEDYPVLVASLQVLPSQHRQGVGRQLLRAAGIKLRARGIHSWLIGCARENPNCGVYPALGGVEHHRAPTTIDRFETIEIFYAWNDISEF